MRISTDHRKDRFVATPHFINFQRKKNPFMIFRLAMRMIASYGFPEFGHMIHNSNERKT